MRPHDDTMILWKVQQNHSLLKLHTKKGERALGALNGTSLRVSLPEKKWTAAQLWTICQHFLAEMSLGDMYETMIMGNEPGMSRY